MTIVTKNSLTLSNVNDGTITHYAYAYSADGKDGFYVGGGRNLLQGTQDFSGSNWLNLGTDWTKTDETYNGLSVVETTSDWNGITQYYQVKQDETYTFSLFARYTSGTGTSSFYIGLNYDPENGHKNAQVDNGTLACSLDTNWKKCSITFTATADGYVKPRMERTNNNTNLLRVCGFMFEEGTVAHHWSPAPLEAHPSYIGQYTDFNTTASTDPARYAPWIIFKGNDGVGIKTTDITYAISTSGTTAPSTGWTSSVPSLVKGQYLWTKTAWTYTDNSSKTGYSVTYISKDGSNGTDGTSGIIVSSVVPASPQTGQLWQDTSTTPQLVKKWTGASWVIWEFYAQNLKSDKLDAISGNLGTMIAGIIKILADIIVNAAGKTKKFGMLFTKKGLLSTGPTFDAAGQASDTKMAAASLTQGELRFLNTDYSEDLEAVQDYATSSANNGYIRFSSTPEKGDLLEITSSKILLNGLTTQTSPWIEASSFAKYRVAFGTVTVSVGLISGSTGNTIYLGSIPTELRPLDGRMFPAPAWWVDTSRDRHFQINADQGNMSLLSPYPGGQEYRFEVTWTIPM